MTRIQRSDDSLQRFACEYGFGGARWGFDVYAKDWDEARQRVKAMGMGQVLGEHVATIPASVPGTGFIVNLVTRFRNWMREPFP